MADEQQESPMVEQIRVAIRASGRSLNELGNAAGVGRDQLSRFIRHERGITLDVAGRICLALGITLNIPESLNSDPEPPPPAPKRRGKK